jgi:hypothetical protein
MMAVSIVVLLDHQIVGCRDPSTLLLVREGYRNIILVIIHMLIVYNTVNAMIHIAIVVAVVVVVIVVAVVVVTIVVVVVVAVVVPGSTCTLPDPIIPHDHTITPLFVSIQPRHLHPRFVLDDVWNTEVVDIVHPCCEP